MPAPATLLATIDARVTCRARQPGHADLRDVVVTITQTATGRRQAVRVAAPDERAARALAMLHATILEEVPWGVDAASQADRHLMFTVRSDNEELLEAPGPMPPVQVQPVFSATTLSESDCFDPAGYVAYSIVIATDPHYWTAANGAEPTVLEARRRAELLADMARNVFPGLRCDLVPGPAEKLDLSSGPDADVRERLEAWVDRRMAEMLGACQ